LLLIFTQASNIDNILYINSDREI